MCPSLISVYDPTHNPLAKDDECSNVYEIAAYSCDDTNRYYEGFINVTKRHNRITTSIREEPDIHPLAPLLRWKNEHHLAVACVAE